jgi:putative ABC transport system substrate-binding protein
MSIQQMRRREFIAGLSGTAAWPLTARATKAQDAGQMPRVGWLSPGSAAGIPSELTGFKQGLRELGYVEGKNIIVEYRFGEHSAERMPDLAADLARLNVSVIVTSLLGFQAVRRAAPDTPIVYFGADMMGSGIVTNLRRPGGNITGVSILRLGGKWPELAKEALPGLSRVGYLFNPTNASGVTNLAEARRSAEALGMDFRTYPIERPEDRQRAFDAMTRGGIAFLLLDASHPYPTDWPRVAELALRHKLPAISEIREFVAAGGLMSYGPNIFDLARLTANYVDKILKGAKAGDLPVEQPTKFELAINLKTAKVLGLTIPSALLARADEVIE